MGTMEKSNENGRNRKYSNRNEECLSSLIIREMKVKTTKRYHHLTSQNDHLLKVHKQMLERVWKKKETPPLLVRM